MFFKSKAGIFKFFRFEERFLKAPFSWRISVDGGSVEMKRRFQISSSLDADLF